MLWDGGGHAGAQPGAAAARRSDAKALFKPFPRVMPQRRTIALDVPPAVARAYEAAPPAEHRKFERLLALSLRARTDEAAFARATDRLERTMDEIGRKARERGLTDAALRDLLQEHPGQDDAE